MVKAKNSIILGIDPGTVVMGYALLGAHEGNLSLVEMGVLRLDTTQEHPERLEAIFQRIQTLVALYRPTCMALEAPFFGKNVQSMLKLGRAQGVAMAAGMLHRLPVTEYAPRSIKQAITGKGNATKETVRMVLEHTLDFTTEEKMPLDATDALSVALCHYYTVEAPVSRARLLAGSPVKKAARKTGRKSTSAAWEAFARSNSDRVG